MSKRKIVLYIAMSLDGFIAKPDGDISWLSLVDSPQEDYGYGDFIGGVDTVIMGRKTYEKVQSFGIEFPHKGRKCYVLSRSKAGFDENVEFYAGDIAELVTDLKNQDGKDIFVDGGAEAVNELLRLDAFDEMTISVIPILLGDGIRLFKEERPEKLLKLKSATSYQSGLVKLYYLRNE